MEHILKQCLAFFNANDLAIQLGTVLLIAALFTWLFLFFVKETEKKLKFTHKRFWLKSFINAIKTPLPISVWGLTLTYLTNIIYTSFTQQSIPHLDQFRQLFVIVMVLWFALRMVGQMQHAVEHHFIMKDKHFDRTTGTVIGQLIRVMLVIISVLMAIPIMGYSISALLAFGGVGTLAIGLAARDSLANFFGGMMVFLDRPFNVGDWVSSPDRNIEGTVEKIGWRLTRIRTFDKRPIFVPNSLFSTIVLENPSRMSNRRIYTTIGLRYCDASKMPVLLAEIETMLRNHPEIDANLTLMVNFVEFGPYSLNFFIYCFTKTTEWVKFQAVQQDVFFKVIAIVEAHDASFAFPTQTLELPEAVMTELRGA